jgi:beta-carotene 3-hydroxylase
MYWWGPFVLLAAFFGMEFMAWATHKFLMHGGMWYFHRDHHQEEPGFFEKNDVFFLIYAIPSCDGIALYGFTYFMIHDVYIHRRFKWLRDIDHPYFMAIRKAHKIHHKYRDKEDGECFGMLIVPKKYYTEAKNTFRRKYVKP